MVWMPISFVYERLSDSVKFGNNYLVALNNTDNELRVKRGVLETAHHYSIPDSGILGSLRTFFILLSRFRRQALLTSNRKLIEIIECLC